VFVVRQIHIRAFVFTDSPLIFISTFGDVWISMLKVHENIGNQRIKFAASISDSAEDLLSLGRNIEKERKKVSLGIISGGEGRILKSDV
jgi:hypothetical protein